MSSTTSPCDVMNGICAEVDVTSIAAIGPVEIDTAVRLLVVRAESAVIVAAVNDPAVDRDIVVILIPVTSNETLMCDALSMSVEKCFDDIS